MLGDRLARWLLERGRLTTAQLDEARRTRAFFGGDLGTHLVNLGFLDEFGLGEALTEITGVPCADEHLRRVAPGVAARLSPELAGRHRACPFAIEGSTLRVAMRNPRDGVALAAIRGATGLEPEAWVASERRLGAALARCYGIEPEGVRGLSVHTPGGPRRPAPDSAAASGGAATAAGDATGEVGLDGLPLDAELSIDDPMFFRGSTDDASAEGPAATDPRTAAPQDATSEDEASGALGRLEERLGLAVDRDDVAIALLEFCRSRAARCALFAVGPEGLRFIAARGRSLNTERLRRTVVPTDGGTVFESVLRAEEFYFGPVPPSPANKDLFSLLGGRLPPSILAVQIRLRGRVVALLYLDGDDRPLSVPDLPLMRRVAAKAGLAFEILLLRGKLRKI